MKMNKIQELSLAMINYDNGIHSNSDYTFGNTNDNVSSMKFNSLKIW